MSEYQQFRKIVGVTQIEAAVRARVSPPTVRNFERFGPPAVDEREKRARLEELYDGFRRLAGEPGSGRAA